MKGQTSEIINLIILVVIVLVVFLISYFMISSPQKSTQKLIEAHSRYEAAKKAVYGFYYTKVPGVSTSYVVLLGYRLVNGNPVYFGDYYPFVDCDKMVTQYFSEYFGNSWGFEVRDIYLGFKKPSEGYQAIEILIPLPSQNNKVEKGYLYVWSN
ncbi:MAG: hypothetical protein N3E38_02820 [Candidatus Aenigmarchaeota archaeon]|nr:hypothetical protein [Candidatus Aenigmarchaeota archaeon]MCX8179637.1 hypothetical protein [Candidatus Aenigmarchaeota archaeon]